MSDLTALEKLTIRAEADKRYNLLWFTWIETNVVDEVERAEIVAMYERAGYIEQADALRTRVFDADYL